jgi:hypothetical protein
MLENQLGLIDKKVRKFPYRDYSTLSYQEKMDYRRLSDELRVTELEFNKLLKLFMPIIKDELRKANKY